MHLASPTTVFEWLSTRLWRRDLPRRIQSARVMAAKARRSLEERIEALVRGDKSDLSSYLHEVEASVRHAGTAATLHCYSLALDGASMPRVDDLVKAICWRVVDYAIPRSEIARAKAYDQKFNTQRATTELVAKARSLFAPVKKSGEGGELLLYMLVQTYLRLPQLFCKMPHKTNKKMHVHGIDGIHAGVSSTGDLILYWGESKLHKTISKSVSECMDSLKPYVCPSAKVDPRERDLQLLRANLDLDDARLTDAILKYLDPDDPKFNKTLTQGICLVGFDYNAYPTKPNIKTITTLQGELRSSLTKWRAWI
jgi:hypothetical protein